MLQAAADILVQTRQRLAGRVADLTQEQWFAQPEGCANNIAWNIGHLVVSQQGLCYRWLGLPMPDVGVDTKAMQANFGNGTSPTDWSEKPDTAELVRLLVEVPQLLSGDIAAGKYDNYVMPEPVEGAFPPAASVAHGFVFNQHHEGFHSGVIDDLLAAV